MIVRCSSIDNWCHGRPSGVGRDADLELRDQLADRARARPRPSCVSVDVVPGVEDLVEDPLRPAVVARVGRRHRPSGVVRQTQPAELAAIGRDVVVRGDRGVLSRLDGVLLGGQPERVEPHGVQDVAAGHPLEPSVDVGADEPERVPDVQPGPRRIREHVVQEQLLADGRRTPRGRRVVRSGSVSRTCPRRPTGPARRSRSAGRARPCSGEEGCRWCQCRRSYRPVSLRSRGPGRRMGSHARRSGGPVAELHAASAPGHVPS